MSCLYRFRIWVRALVMVAIFGSNPHISIAQSTLADGRLTFRDGTGCNYRSQYFGKPARDHYWLCSNEDCLKWRPFSRLPEHMLHTVPLFGPPYRLYSRCDGFGEEVILPSLVGPDSLSTLDIVLPNARPHARASAYVKSLQIQGAPPGAVIRLNVLTSDPDGDQIETRWRVTAGTLASPSARTTNWTLPASRGLHFAYVLVSDRRGGLVERRVAVSTDGGYVAASRASTGAAVRPSDRVPANDHFLTAHSTRFDFGFDVDLGADSAQSACRYYRDIGVVRSCATDGSLVAPRIDFKRWKQKWGFREGGTQVRARYANVVDLDLQRDMNGTSTPDGVAFYVSNHANTDAELTNVRSSKNLVATVAMEYTKRPNWEGGKPFGVFLVFGPGGNLLTSVNLDGRGEKYIPGVCVACHGAPAGYRRYAETGDARPVLDVQFLPFDLDNFAFSSSPELKREAQEDAFRLLNALVLKTNPNPAITELIAGWHAGPSGRFDGSFAPAAWRGANDRPLYDGVVKPYCRMCHVALQSRPRRVGEPENALRFATPQSFASYIEKMEEVVCGIDGNPQFRSSMPNALVTFDRFWSAGPHPGQTRNPRELMVAAIVEQRTLRGDTWSRPAQCELPRP